MAAIIPLQQKGNVCIVIHGAHGDGVVGWRKETLLGDDLRYQEKAGRFALLPAFIVGAIGYVTFYLASLDYGIFRPYDLVGLHQRSGIIGHMPAVFNTEFLFTLRISKRGHLGTGNADADAGKDVLRIITATEGPGLGQVAWPGALTGVTLESFGGITLTVLTMALGAAITFMKQFFTLGNTLR